jgi:hypothetical protein
MVPVAVLNKRPAGRVPVSAYDVGVEEGEVVAVVI